MFALIRCEYAYRHQYRSVLRSLVEAIRVGIYNELRRCIDWIEPPRVSYEEWRRNQERDVVGCG